MIGVSMRLSRLLGYEDASGGRRPRAWEPSRTTTGVFAPE
jgi:hypothetical protein